MPGADLWEDRFAERGRYEQDGSADLPGDLVDAGGLCSGKQPDDQQIQAVVDLASDHRDAAVPGELDEVASDVEGGKPETGLLHEHAGREPDDVAEDVAESDRLGAVAQVDGARAQGRPCQRVREVREGGRLDPQLAPEQADHRDGELLREQSQDEKTSELAGEVRVDLVAQQ